MEIYLPSWLPVLLLPLCALLLWFLICWPCSIPSTENSHFIPAFRTSASGIIQSSKILSSKRLSLYFDDRLLILDLLEQPLTGDTWWQSSNLPNTLSDSVHVEPKGSKPPARVTLKMIRFCSILPEQAMVPPSWRTKHELKSIQNSEKSTVFPRQSKFQTRVLSQLGPGIQSLGPFKH